MFKEKIAGLIVKARCIFLAAAIVLAVICAFTIKKTRINYDLNRYLADDTMTKRAMTVMDDEFGSSEQLRIMFTDRTESEVRGYTEKLNAMPEIILASHDPEKDVRTDGGKTYSLVTLTLGRCDSLELVSRLRSMFPEAGEYYVGGFPASQIDIQKAVAEEIPVVMLIAVAVVLIVLFITSRSFLEPIVIMIVLSVSIIINMGTNFVFKDISFITFAVCAILQLALSIDYAIMLLHTYNAFRDGGMDAKEAMRKSLAECFMRISSSAFTTIAGLLSLLFMSLTIGFDIGLALSKGIIISMLGVFLFMPGVVLLFEKPLRKTLHKPIRLGGANLAKLIARIRIPLAIVLVLAVFAALYMNSRIDFIFTDSKTNFGGETVIINEKFGSSDPLVILIPGGEEDEDYERQREFINELKSIRRNDGSPAIVDVAAMTTTGAEALKYYSAEEVAELSGIDLETVERFFKIKRYGSAVRADRLIEDAGAFASGSDQLAELTEALAAARSAFIGKDHQRLVAGISFTTTDDDFHDCMDRIIAASEKSCGSDFYITGFPMSNYDIGNAFKGDLLKVNLITLCAILLIVALSFRSLRIAGLLVFVIEGAIWITMGISSVFGKPIFFISYLICLSIQMGATIDYGILLTDQYRRLRRGGSEPREALIEALNKALPTVLTSGIILTVAGFIIGKICSIYYIYSIGLLVSRGALVSVILVLTLLPALLLIGDRFIIGKKKRR